MKEVKRYTVVILLNSDGSKVLLQKKDRTVFAGMLNGIGGKVEEGEEPRSGGLREIEEETTLVRGDIEDFTWIGTLTIPVACDIADGNKIPEVIFYAGKVKDESKAKKAPDATEEVDWYRLDCKNAPFTDMELAGDGDLIYFIGRARTTLFGENPVNFE